MITDNPATTKARLDQDAYDFYRADSPSTLNLLRHLVGLGMTEFMIRDHMLAQHYDQVTASRMASAAAHIWAHRELIKQDTSVPGGRQ